MKRNKIFFTFLFSFFVTAAAYPLTDAVTSAEEYYRQGQVLYGKGDYIGANAAFKAAESIIDAADTGTVTEVPAVKALTVKTVAAEQDMPHKDFVFTAREAYLAGRFNDAVGLYKQALEKSPADDNVKYNLAMAFLNSDDYQNAAYWLKDIIKNNPSDAEACYNLGVIYESFLPDYGQAVFYYRKFLKNAPSRFEADQVKEWIKYIENQTD